MFFVDLVVHNVVTSDLFRFRLKLDIFSYLENPAWNFLTEGQMEERDIFFVFFLIMRLKSNLILRLTTSLVVDKSYKSHINFWGASQSSLLKKKKLGGWVIPHLD